MVTNQELEQLIDDARQFGAIIRTKRDTSGDPVSSVQIRSGIPGVGDGWMPPIAAAEKLREFVSWREKTPNGDFVFRAPCGCTVRFFAHSDFHTSRMSPGPHCTAHVQMSQTADRDALRAEAKEAMRTWRAVGSIQQELDERTAEGAEAENDAQPSMGDLGL